MTRNNIITLATKNIYGQTDDSTIIATETIKVDMDSLEFRGLFAGLTTLAQKQAQLATSGYTTGQINTLTNNTNPSLDDVVPYVG